MSLLLLLVVAVFAQLAGALVAGVLGRVAAAEPVPRDAGVHHADWQRNDVVPGHTFRKLDPVFHGGTRMEPAHFNKLLGRMTLPDPATITDLSFREAVLFVPLLVLTFWIGIYPISFGHFFGPSTALLAEQHTVTPTSMHRAPGIADGGSVNNKPIAWKVP